MHKFRPVISMRFTRFCVAFGTLSSIAALGLGGQTAWADSSCTPPSNGPTGPSAATFTYQCDGTYAGDWTNTYYVYDPTTGTQTALYSPDYTYDCTTGTWTQAEWDYDTASGAYIENQVAATAPPDQPTNCATTAGSNTTDSNAQTGPASTTSSGDSTPSTDPDTSGTSTTNPTSNSTAPDPQSDPTTCPTPDGAQSTSSSDPNGNADATATNGATINNTDCSQSQSGNAAVTNNGSAGDATSGDATTEVNIANLVQTLSNALGIGTTTFTTNIDGDMNGDLVLDPSTILANAGSTDPNDQSADPVSDVNNGASINNVITATATTGDATVAGNGDGGNATTGNAEAIVNLINMINSAVASGQSFIGTININGDLNGNILIPQSVIDELMGTNAPSTDASDANTALNNNESITNNVTTNAASGDATVADNHSGGNATTGNADTNVTLLNMTGSSIVGKNVLLVFVNVLGQWVGMIVNAPTGATSAEFGGGITSDTPGTGSGVVEADANLNITNDVDASAVSGNALVAHNYNGGNATSGNADTAVNILNVENSTLSLANWFGILFINVFGTWNGNFGILATPAAASNSTDPSSNQSITPVTQNDTPHHHFATFLSDNGDTNATDASAVLGDATTISPVHKFNPNVITTSSTNDRDSYVITLLGLFLALTLLAGAERNRFTHGKKTK